MTTTARQLPLARFRRLLQPRSVFWIGLVFAILLTTIQAGAALLALDKPGATLANDLLSMVSSLAATLGIIYGMRWSYRVDRQIGAAWWLFMLAMLNWALGDVFWAYYELIAGGVPYPSFADLFYLAAYVFFFLGILRIPHLRDDTSPSAWLWLDIFLVMFSAGIVFWNFLIGPLFLDDLQPWFVTLVNAAYPIGDLFLIMTILLIVVLPRSPLWMKPMYVMVAGHALSAVADVIYLYQTINGTYDSGAFFNILFSMSPLVLMMSGLLQAVTAERVALGRNVVPAPQTNRVSLVQLTMPFAGLLVAFVLLGLGASSKQVLTSSEFLILLGGLISVVAVRQTISAFNNKRLSLQLLALNDELEKRVAARAADLIEANQNLLLEMEERKHTEMMLREREEKLTHFGLHDILTGLPNRSLLLDHIGKAIARFRRHPEDRFAILFLDFDGFKVVNDSLGHPCGDQLLVQIGERLSQHIRDEDTVARLGGDEFVILLQGFDDEHFVAVAADRILESLQEPFLVSFKPIYITASIGMVMADANYQTADEVIRDADLAMYEAKSKGKACHVLFQPQLRLTAIKRLALDTELHDALKKNEFVLHFQPIVSLKSKRIAGFEALIRWNHPTLGLIVPTEFLSIAEFSGFMDFITYFTLQEACRQLAQWRSLFRPDQPPFVSVNLSPSSLRHPELLQWIDDSLAAASLSPGALVVEIVENALIQEADNARHIFTDMRRLGIQVSLDDFGIGYSSLGYINQYPIDSLKIDRSFVSQVPSSKEMAAIVRAITSLAGELGLKLIAEGIETQSQLDFLAKLGCDYGQGFFFSKALAPADVPALFARDLF